MEGVDINVLVRYFVNDDESQHKLAKKFINENDIFIGSIVLVEAFWVWKKLYKLNKENIEQIFDHIKRSTNIKVEDEVVFFKASSIYTELGCDFGDAMIVAVNRDKVTETVTFDKNAAKKLGMRLLIR